MTKALQMKVEVAAMSSCLGPLVTACAAFRAGISRARASREFQYFPEEDNVPVPLTACAIPEATLGFSGAGRLVAILCETLVDLQSRLSLQELGADTCLFLVLPDALEREFPMRSELREDEARRREVLGSFVLKQTFDNLGIAWKGAERRFFTGGPVALARALQATQEAFDSRRARACLLLVVDSLLSPPTLHQLVLHKRLKTEDHPTGFIPGEAGVALLLRPAEGAGSPVCIQRTQVLETPGDGCAPGRALATCVEKVLPPDVPVVEEPLLVSDHNGGQRHANEWGHLLLHLRTAHPTWRLERSWFPAMGFGETGAVSAALGICVTLRGLARGYAPARSAVVLSSEGTEGPRSAILLSLKEGLT